MGLALSGPAASFLALQTTNGQSALVLTAIPTAATLNYVLTEDETGYDNTPHQTSGTLTYAGFSSGGGGNGSDEDVDPIIQVLDPTLIPAARLVKPTLTPTKTATTLATSYATVYSALMSPGSQLDWFVDLSGEIKSEQVDTITYMNLNSAAAYAGLSVTTQGSLRPLVDQTHGLLRFVLTCSPANGTSFSGVVYAGIKIRVSTVGGVIPRIYEFTVAVMVVQL